MNIHPKELMLVMTMLAVIVGMVLWSCSPGEEEKDYRAVGERFIKRNAIIARKIGKIQRFDHFGDGGGGGSVSYNVYRLTGAQGTAVCHLTLLRSGEDRWKVDAAILTLNGTDYRIPTRKAGPGRSLGFWGKK